MILHPVMPLHTGKYGGTGQYRNNAGSQKLLKLEARKKECGDTSAAAETRMV